MGYEAVALTDLNFFFMGSEVPISVPFVDIIWPISTRSGMGDMGTYMVHVPLNVSGLILHGTFQTKFLGILYHKIINYYVN